MESSEDGYRRLGSKGAGMGRPGDPAYRSRSIGPATRCDAAHPRWDVLKHLRCIKIACDVLRCIFQHVGIFAFDFGISQSFIIQFPNGFQHCDGYLINIHVTYESTLSVKYF